MSFAWTRRNLRPAISAACIVRRIRILEQSLSEPFALLTMIYCESGKQHDRNVIPAQALVTPILTGGCRETSEVFAIPTASGFKAFGLCLPNRCRVETMIGTGFQ